MVMYAGRVVVVLFLVLLLQLAAVTAQDGTLDGIPENLLPVSTLYSFPVGSFVENVAVRRSGELLITINNRREYVQIDPLARNPIPVLVHTFPAGVASSVEVEPDVFYVNSGVIGQNGTAALYRVCMKGFKANKRGEVIRPARVEKLLEIPEALFLNGMDVLDRAAGTILVTDSLLGVLFRVDTNASPPSYDIFLRDQLLGKTSSDPELPGANGVRVFDGTVYISNTEQQLFMRVPVDQVVAATGPIEILTENIGGADDFALDEAGNAYITTHIFNSLVRRRPDGTLDRVAGGLEDVVVAGSTSAAFGRTRRDRNILYVTTEGGILAPVNGVVGPGRVLKIDTGSERHSKIEG